MIEVGDAVYKHLHNFPVYGAPADVVVVGVCRIWPKMLSFSVEKVKSILFA